MKKIKYQGGVTKLITSQIGKRNKERFTNLISKTEKLKELFIKVNIGGSIKIDIVSFSSSFDFSEQVLSILSFVKFVGIPLSWTIYSDGSHTPKQIELLEDIMTFAKIEKINLFDETEVADKIKSTIIPWKEELLHYAQNKPLGKKLFYYLNHIIKKPTLFLDSDILFYSKANVITDQLDYDKSGYFLPDILWGNLDSRYLKQQKQQLYQINSGFYLVNKEFSFLRTALDYLKSLNSEYEYFTEQTTLHIIAIENHFIPLDPRIFILNSADQFDFSYLYGRNEMAIRHYTGPVRHKMWQKDWKWQLSLS